MKKTPLKKRSKQKISVVQRKLWELCKQIIRQKNGNSCYTCGQSGLQGSNWHTGHLWAKASLGAYLKYDLRVLRPQCYNCNINRGGQGADFYARMLKEIGPKEMRKLEADRRIVLDGFNGRLSAMDHYLNLIDLYQKLLDELNKNHY